MRTRVTSYGLLAAVGLASVGAGADAQLEKAIAAKMAEVRKKAGAGFRVKREGLFIVAGDLSRHELDRFCRGTITRGAELMWKAYFKKKPDYPIVIYLFAGKRSYDAGRKKLFNDTEPSHYGYYRPWDKTLVMNIRTGGGTLVHELTHALTTPDFPDCPTWLFEGLGSLHEQCSYGRDTIIGLENWRLPGLQEAIRGGRLVPLAKLIATTDRQFRGANSGLHYAEARYLCMYLQTKGWLRTFYRKFRDNYPNDKTGAKTLVAVTGRPIAQLQNEWLPWVKGLRFPPRR